VLLVVVADTLTVALCKCVVLLVVVADALTVVAMRTKN